MKKEPKLHKDPDMLGEYDLSNGVRGKYANHTGPQSKTIVHGKPRMRELFPAYYPFTQEDFDAIWAECIFAFDANVLLHIYKYSAKTRNEFFKVLRRLRNRLWIPHQVAYEYQNRRLVAISEQHQAYYGIEESLKGTKQKLESDLAKYATHEFANVQQIVKNIAAIIEEEKSRLKKVKAKHPDYKQADLIREKIERLFDGKIGEPYTEDELESLYAKAERRIRLQMPPGYKDAPRIGDIIIWYQLLDYARIQQKPLIFITDDAKEDWWLKDGSFGPRPELIQEMYNMAGVQFYMYLTDGFLKEAKDFLKLQDEQEVITQAIEEIREVRQQDEALEVAAEAVKKWDFQAATAAAAVAAASLPAAQRTLDSMAGLARPNFLATPNLDAIMGSYAVAQQFPMMDKEAAERFRMLGEAFVPTNLSKEVLEAMKQWVLPSPMVDEALKIRLASLSSSISEALKSEQSLMVSAAIEMQQRFVEDQQRQLEAIRKNLTVGQLHKGLLGGYGIVPQEDDEIEDISDKEVPNNEETDRS